MKLKRNIKARGRKRQQLENIEKCLKPEKGSLKNFKIVTVDEFEEVIG